MSTMTRTSPAARGGIRNATRSSWKQAVVELRNSLTGGALLSYLTTPIGGVFLLWMFRDEALGDTGLTAAHYMLPGFLAATIVLGGFMGVSSEMVSEREDGSLLRMKAIPHGLRGYVLGKSIYHVLFNLIIMAALMIGAIALNPSLAPDSALGWLGLVGYTVLGLLACLPMGMALGALMKTSMMIMIPMALVVVLLIVSGVFTPLNADNTLQTVIAHIFPMYWLGLGMRSVVLPMEAASVEIGESWRVLETVGVLGLWAVVGMILAPIALRRMIRGVSGSTMQAVRDRVLSKGY